MKFDNEWMELFISSNNQLFRVVAISETPAQNPRRDLIVNGHLQLYPDHSVIATDELGRVYIVETKAVDNRLRPSPSNE